MNNPTNNKERGDSLNQEITEIVVCACSAVSWYCSIKTPCKFCSNDIKKFLSIFTTALTKSEEDERARCVERLNKADFYPLCNTLSYEVSQFAIKAITD